MTTSLLSEMIHERAGWCPHAPVLRTSPAIFGEPSGIIHSDRPDGGDGIPRRLQRGMGIASGSIRMLINHKRLLGFSLLTGVAVLVMFVSEYLIRLTQTCPYPEMTFPVWFALTFGIEVITVFWITVLLAGTIASASSLSGRNAILPEPATILSLAGWSVVLAFIGTTLFVIVNLYAGDLFLILLSVVTRFPFAGILEPGMNGPGPMTGLFHQSYAAANTLLLTLINIVLFAVTLYVVPAIVLEKKGLTSAVTESAVLARKTGTEILSCFLVFFLALFAVSAISVLFGLVFGMVSVDSPFWSAFYYQGGWYAAGVVYIVVWYILVVTGSTAFGIAMFNLYDYGKTGLSSVPAIRTSGGEPIH